MLVWILKRIGWTGLLCWFEDVSCSLILPPRFLKIRSVRILDSIVCSNRWFGCSLQLWMPSNSPPRRPSSSVSCSLASDTVVLQDECLIPFYLSPTQNILPFTQLVLKLVVCVCVTSSAIWSIAIMIAILDNTYNILLLCTICPICTLWPICSVRIAIYIVSNNDSNNHSNILYNMSAIPGTIIIAIPCATLYILIVRIVRLVHIVQSNNILYVLSRSVQYVTILWAILFNITNYTGPMLYNTAEKDECCCIPALLLLQIGLRARFIHCTSSSHSQWYIYTHW